MDGGASKYGSSVCDGGAPNDCASEYPDLGPSPDVDPNPECEAPDSVSRSHERYAGGRRPEGERYSPKTGPPSSCRSSENTALDGPMDAEWPLCDVGGDAKAAPDAAAKGGTPGADDKPPSEVSRLAWVAIGAADPIAGPS